MKRKTLFVLAGMLAVAGMVFAAPSSVSVLDVEYEQVKAGLLVRDKADATSVAVIKSFEGFQRFKQVYPVNLELKRADFEDSFYVAGFSDTRRGITVENFQRTGARPMYYLVIAETDTDADTVRLPLWKKYSSYAMIRVPNYAADKNRIGHILIPGSLAGSSTQWF